MTTFRVGVSKSKSRKANQASPPFFFSSQFYAKRDLQENALHQTGSYLPETRDAGWGGGSDAHEALCVSGYCGGCGVVWCTFQTPPPSPHSLLELELPCTSYVAVSRASRQQAQRDEGAGEKGGGI